MVVCLQLVTAKIRFTLYKLLPLRYVESPLRKASATYRLATVPTSCLRARCLHCPRLRLVSPHDTLRLVFALGLRSTLKPRWCPGPRPAILRWRYRLFYKRGCQEHSSSSAGSAVM